MIFKHLYPKGTSTKGYNSVQKQLKYLKQNDI